MSWHANKTRAQWCWCHSVLLGVCWPFCSRSSLYQPQRDWLICMRAMLTRLSKCHSLCSCISQGWANPNTSWLEPWDCGFALKVLLYVDRGLDTWDQHLFRCVSDLNLQYQRAAWQQKLWIVLEHRPGYFWQQSPRHVPPTVDSCLHCNKKTRQILKMPVKQKYCLTDYSRDDCEERYSFTLQTELWGDRCPSKAPRVLPGLFWFQKAPNV